MRQDERERLMAEIAELLTTRTVQMADGTMTNDVFRYTDLAYTQRELREVFAAADLLEDDFQITADVWSVTSFTELRRDGLESERWNRLHPLQPARSSHLADCIAGDAPVIAATDYVRAVPQLIASYIQPRYTVLGTDGFGRSDTRIALRKFFEIDRHHIVVAALASLAAQGACDGKLCADAIAYYGIDPEAAASWEC